MRNPTMAMRLAVGLSASEPTYRNPALVTDSGFSKCHSSWTLFYLEWYMVMNANEINKNHGSVLYLFMKKYRSLILAIVLIGSAPVAPAAVQALEYDFVSVKYLGFSSKEYGAFEDVDGKGYALDLSITVGPNFAVTAKLYRIQHAEVTALGENYTAEIRTVSLGGQINMPLSKVSDLILGVGFISGEVRVGGDYGGSEDADGSEVHFGFRTMPYDRLEVNGFIDKNTVENVKHIGFSLGAAFYAGKSLSIDMGFSLDRKTSLLAIGLTKYF